MSRTFFYIFILIMLSSVPLLLASNSLSWDNAAVSEEETTLFFKISWKKDYRMVADPEEKLVYFDIPKVEVEKTRLISFGENNLVDNVKLGQYSDDTARIVIYLREKSSKYNISSLFKIEDNQTIFAVTLRKKDLIGEIITENSFTVMLDPGHGGVDPGCVSPKGYREKDVVLKMAEAIKAEFDRRNLGILLMTRTGDVFLSLEERMKIAENSKASLFVSLHVDSYPKDKKVRGSGIYYLSQRGATDKRTETLAQNENSSDQIGGIKLSENQELFQILFSLKQTEAIKRSATFSGILNEKMNSGGIETHGVKQAGFRVLKIPDMPAVLQEIGFFSNSYEEKLLTSDVYRKKFARAFADALEDYKNNWWKKRF